MLLECLLFAGIITLLIIIISIVAGADFNLKETMSKIRRTIGGYKNPADNNSSGGPDYKSVWTDGIRIYSCDECPSKQMCPNCPRFRNTSIESFSGGESPDPASGKDSKDGKDGKDGKDSKDSNSKHTSALISLDAPVKLAAATEHEFRDEELSVLGKMTQSSLGPAYDLDPDFVSSRSSMGAGCGVPTNRSKISIRGLTYDTASLGTRNDDIFDGDRKVTHGCARGGRSSLKLLYTNTMGLENPVPFTASCEFIGAQGYLYKDTCALGTVYP